MLIGGRSRRMGGGDKFRLELGGRSLLEHVCGRLRPQVDAIVLSGRKGMAADRFAYELVEDSFDDVGPLGGIHAALAWASHEFGLDACVLTVPADTPFIPRDLALILRRRMQESDAEVVVAWSSGGQHHAVGLWQVRLQERLRVWIEEGRSSAIHAFLAEIATAVAEFDGDPDSFFNINTPADLNEAMRFVEGVAP